MSQVMRNIADVSREELALGVHKFVEAENRAKDTAMKHGREWNPHKFAMLYMDTTLGVMNRGATNVYDSVDNELVTLDSLDDAPSSGLDVSLLLARIYKDIIRQPTEVYNFLDTKLIPQDTTVKLGDESFVKLTLFGDATASEWSGTGDIPNNSADYTVVGDTFNTTWAVSTVKSFMVSSARANMLNLDDFKERAAFAFRVVNKSINSWVLNGTSRVTGLKNHPYLAKHIRTDAIGGLDGDVIISLFKELTMANRVYNSTVRGEPDRMFLAREVHDYLFNTVFDNANKDVTILYRLQEELKTVGITIHSMHELNDMYGTNKHGVLFARNGAIKTVMPGIPRLVPIVKNSINTTVVVLGQTGGISVEDPVNSYMAQVTL